MQEALKEPGRLLPAEAQAPEMLNPGDGAFDRPALLVLPQGSAVLRRVLAIGALRGEELGALGGWYVTGQRKFVYRGWRIVRELDAMDEDAIVRKYSSGESGA